MTAYSTNGWSVGEDKPLGFGRSGGRLRGGAGVARNDGLFAGACPSHELCAGCCTQRCVGYALRPNGRYGGSWAVARLPWVLVRTDPRRISDHDVLHVASAAAQHLVHSRRSIRAEMETIRHLDRIRGALPSAFGIRTSSIPDDDLDAGV